MARKKDTELATLNAKLKVANRMAESSRGSQNALDAKLADARKEVAELRAELEAKEKAIVDARAEGMAEGERAMERKLKVEELQEQLKEMVRLCVWLSTSLHRSCAAHCMCLRAWCWRVGAADRKVRGSRECAPRR